MERLTLLFMILGIAAFTTRAAFGGDQVNGRLVVFNDNGAWCWFQGDRVVVDQANNSILFSSVAVSKGVDGPARSGDVDLVSYSLQDGISQRFVLHHNLQHEDDHNSAGILIRPDGRYVAMYTRHNQSALSYWRVSKNPGDAINWQDEKTFDWSPYLSADGSDHVTYSNLYYLSAEKRTYDFTRAVNLDPSILTSDDLGNTWKYCGKLLTLPKLGYVNGYTKYASNNIDRIDFLTTDHHPRDFDNNIYHGYVQGGKVHASDGTVIDEKIVGSKGHPNTELPKVFPASSTFNGELMTHAWIADIRLDAKGQPCAIITARANDIPDNTNFQDHRFFYARWDGSAWKVHQVAKAGPCLWESEQDYTGLAALVPNDCNTLFISTPIDPRSGKETPKHEIYKGITADNGATWKWSAITENSSTDNLRPYIPVCSPGNIALLWFRGWMHRSQQYDCAMVGIIDRAEEKLGDTQSVKIDATNTKQTAGTARQPTSRPASTAPASTTTASTAPTSEPAPPQRSIWSTQIAAPAAGRFIVSALFRGNPKQNIRIQAGLSEKSLLWFGPMSTQQVENTGLYRADLARLDLKKGQPIDLTFNDAIGDHALPANVQSITFTEILK